MDPGPPGRASGNVQRPSPECPSTQVRRVDGCGLGCNVRTPSVPLRRARRVDWRGMGSAAAPACLVDTSGCKLTPGPERPSAEVRLAD
eukprot:1259289-Alexandrium_andersonii.AAC.1